jgi:hypothetical protein
MTVKADPKWKGYSLPGYGEYVGEYNSDHGHATAKLFREDDEFLVAHLSYDRNLDPSQITDHYRADLENLAREQGLKLKILHVA